MARRTAADGTFYLVASARADPVSGNPRSRRGTVPARRVARGALSTFPQVAAGHAASLAGECLGACSFP
jgi:hypothetical protein